jgi:hypothetical protein
MVGITDREGSTHVTYYNKKSDPGVRSALGTIHLYEGEILSFHTSGHETRNKGSTEYTVYKLNVKVSTARLYICEYRTGLNIYALALFIIADDTRGPCAEEGGVQAMVAVPGTASRDLEGIQGDVRRPYHTAEKVQVQAIYFWGLQVGDLPDMQQCTVATVLYLDTCTKCACIGIHALTPPVACLQFDQGESPVD